MASISADPPVASTVPRSRRRSVASAPGLTRGTLIAAALGVFLAQFTLTVPAGLNGLFQQDFSTSASELTWITDAFLVPVTVLELTFGLLGDLFGRRRLLVGGAITIALGCLVCVLTPGVSGGHTSRLAMLWTGQVITGIGAAAVIPTSLALVAAGTHTAKSRARSIGIWGASLSMGSVLSPLACGIAARYSFNSDVNAGWRWAFLMVIALALVSAVVSFAFAQNSSSPEGRGLDWPGQIAIALAGLGILFAVIQASSNGWSSGQVVAGFVVAAVAIVAFIVAESRATSPLLRLDLFASRSFTVAAVVTVVGMFCYLGTGYITSIRLTAIQGFTPLRAAVAFMIFNGAAAFVQITFASRLIAAFNPKWLLGGGLLLIAAGDFWMWQIDIETHSVNALTAPLVVAGIGVGFAISAVTAVVINTVPNHLAGMAAGWASLLRDFGFTLGPAIVGTIALTSAANTIASKVQSDPDLGKAVAAFNASAANAPAAQRPAREAAIGAVNSGPLGANAVPASVMTPDGTKVPLNPLQDTTFHALGGAYSTGYLIVGLCAVAAALAALLIGGRPTDTLVTEESLVG